MESRHWIAIGAAAIALGGMAVAGVWHWASSPPSSSIGPSGASEGREAARVFATPNRRVILATAPSWVSLGSLGRPVDENFIPLSGTSGASLFPASLPRRTDQNAISHMFRLIETDVELKANAAGWGLGSASVGTSRSRSFATYRAFQDRYTMDIDDSVKMAQSPQGAVYYVWRVHFGYLYEAVASGTSDSVNAELSADFVAGKIGAAADFKKRGLSVEAKGKGLSAASGEAIFAKTQEDIERSYKTDGPPVPIFVEYSTIPTATAPSERRVVATTVPVTVKFTEIRIYEDGTLFSSNWSAQAECEVNGRQHIIEEEQASVLNKKVRDSSVRGPRGPSGKEFFGRYTLDWRYQFEVPVGASLRCGLTGKIDNGTRLIPRAQFAPLIVVAGGATKRGTFETTGDAEYVVDYSVEFGQ